MITILRTTALHILLYAVLLWLPNTTEVFTLYLLYVVGRAVLSYPQITRDLNSVQQRGRAGYLYAFFDVGSAVPAVKIGRETRKASRLASHKTAAPLGIVTLFNFSVKDAVAAERYLHQRYAGLRLSQRNEWFCVSPSLLVELILLAMLRKG